MCGTGGGPGGQADGTRISLFREIRFPHSLGMLYSTFTAYLGFAVNEDEYKVMGLAAYGRPTMVDQVRKVIRRTPDGAFAIVPEYFEYQTTAARSYSPSFVDLFGPPRPSYQPIDVATTEGRRYADIAASVQRVLEDTLVDIARALHEETKLPDLCFGGGVALNGVANARILAESGFERLFVPPAPGDAGCAIGAALYADRVYFKNPDRDVPDHPQPNDPCHVAFRAAVQAAVEGWRYAPSFRQRKAPGPDIDKDGKPDFERWVQDGAVAIYIDYEFLFRVVDGKGEVRTR